MSDASRPSQISFCDGLWSLEIKRTMDFELDTPPEHRFALQLGWVSGGNCR